MSAKWGVFGKSFNEIGQAIKERINDVNNALDITNDLSASLKDSPSILARLFPTKESIQSQLIDVDKMYPEIDPENFDFNKWINELNEFDKSIKAGKDSWQDYSNSLDENKRWIAEWGQETEGQIRTQKQMIAANKAARQSALAHNAALKQQTLGAKAAAIGLDALKTIGNTLAYTFIAAAISAAANAIITKITDIVNAYENGVKKIKDLTDEVKSLESEQSSLNDELKESKERLYELQQIKMPTLFEEGEIENLKEYNKQLEAQIRLKELELELKKKEANETAQQTFKNSQIDNFAFDDPFTEDYDWWENVLNFVSNGIYQHGRNAFQNAANWFEGNTWGQQEDYLKNAENSLTNYEGTRQALQNYQTIIDNLDKYQEHIANSEAVTPEDIYSIFGEDILEKLGVGLDDFTVFLDQMGTEGYAVNYRVQLEDKINASKEKLDEYISNLTTRLSDWRIELAGLDPNDSDNAERIKQLNDVIARAEEVIHYESRNKNFLDVYGNVEYSDVVVQLEALAKEGKLTENTFNNVEGIDKFKAALEGVGETDIAHVIYSIIEEVKNADNATQSAANSFENLADRIADIKENSSKTISNVKTFTDATEKIKGGDNLSYDEAIELMELDPSLASGFIKTADGYSIAINKLIAADEEYRKNAKSDISEEMNNTSAEIRNWQKKLAELQTAKRSLKDKEIDIKAQFGSGTTRGQTEYLQKQLSDNAVAIKNIDTQINEAINQIQNGNDLLSVLKVILGELSQSASTIKAMSFSGLSSSYELLNSAINDFNNEGIITLSTLEKIIDAYPELKGVIDQYLRGLISENELITKLSESYEQDENSYYKYLLVKMGYNEDYVNAALDGNDGIVAYFAKNYEIDLANFSDYISRKKAVQAAFDSYVAGGLSRYFDENGNETSEYLALPDMAKSGIHSIYDQYLLALEELEDFRDLDAKFQTDLASIRDKTQSSLRAENGSLGGSSTDASKTFNWIERAIEKVQKAFSRLGTIASNTYKALTTRNNALAGQIKTIRNEIELQQTSYAAYMAKANSVGLSSDLMEKVQNGAIDIRDYDSKTAEIIDEYKEWYDKAQDCKDAIDELHKSLADLYKDRFDNIQKDFDNKLSEIEHLSNTYNIGIDTAEAKGYLQSVKYYAALQDAQRNSLSILNKELSSLQSAFSEAMKSGEIEEYSEGWYELKSSINDVSEEILKASQTLAEYAKTMREIEWEHFDYLQERISDITTEANFLLDLIGNNKLLDGKGNYTDKGFSYLGLHAQNYNVLMAQADKYAEEIAAIERQIANDPYNNDLIERKRELLELQQDTIKSAEDEKQAMLDLAKEGIQEQINALKELIDAYEKALGSAKDLHDYQKQIADHTSEISKLEKQLEAYKNDNSEETKATVQKLEEQLKQAKEDLQETEYERYISEQKKLLDELYTEYEDYMNERMDNIESEFGDLIQIVNDNSAVIADVITTAADDAGYILSDSMSSIWNDTANGIKDIITVYGDKFTDKLTTVNDTLRNIAISVNGLVGAADSNVGNNINNIGSNGTSLSTDNGNGNTNTGDRGNVGNSGNNESNSSANKPITVGGRIYAGNAPIYDYAGAPASEGEKQTFAYDPIYTVLKELNNCLLVRWHKADSGYSGWFKKSDVRAYKTGGLVNYTGLAQLDGTPSKPEYILNARDTQNFFALNKELKQLNDSGVLNNLSNICTRSVIPKDFGIQRADMSSNIEMGGIHINIDHVQDYNDFVNQLRSDRKFEKFIQSMTVDRLAGKGSLGKNNFKW